MLLARIKNSLTARTNTWRSRHFQLTKYGRKLAKYKDIHKGERCFVIGNGPSLTTEDLQILYDNHVVTFGTNRVFHIFDKTQWRPTYYVSEDPIILESIQDKVAEVPCNARFLPINLRWENNIQVPNATWFYQDYWSELKETCGLSLDVAKGIRCKGTVTISCIQLAIYMGFSEIYLLGVDHNYSRYTDSSGNVVEDPTVKDYFSDAYDTDFKSVIGRNLDATTLSYLSVEELSRKIGTFKVYNATRGGKLEVYQRVNFETLFQ